VEPIGSEGEPDSTIPPEKDSNAIPPVEAVEEPEAEPVAFEIDIYIKNIGDG
jgi:hypothetical protein